jgi:DNA-binding CsgD family transcriptional regulator
MMKSNMARTVARYGALRTREDPLTLVAAERAGGHPWAIHADAAHLLQLLERERELAQLEAAVTSAAAGVGALAVVEGSAGIGKTRLLAAARRDARERGMRELTARGAALESDFPYGVVRQLLEPAVAAERDELLSGAAALAAPLFGGIAAPPAGSDASFAVLHGLHWLVAGLAARTPLVLTVDDLHWADLASLRFMGYLARRLDELPVALVVAARPAESPPAVGDLAAEPGARVVRPRPLTVAAVAALVGGRVGATPDGAFAAACHEATGGTPFLVGELARSLAEEGLEPVAVQADRVRGLGPRSIAHAVLARVERLGPPARRAARALAVLGPDAQLRHVAALADITPAEAAAAADAMAAAGILRPGRPLAFAHPIMHAAVAADVGAGERAAGHARAARLFADEGAAPDAVATHLLASDPTGDPWAVEQLRAAARSAVGQGAPHSAVAYLRRALAEPPGADVRAGVLLELGFAESYVGEPEAALHLDAALDGAGDRSALVAATLALGRMIQLSGRHGDAFAIYDRTAQRLGGADPRTALVLEGALVSAAQLDPTTAGAASERLPRLRARVAAEPDPPLTVFGPLAIAAAMDNEPADLVATLARRPLAGGLRIFPEAADRPPFFYHCVTALMFAERCDEAAAHIEDQLAEAQRLGAVQHIVGLAATRAWLRWRTGALAEAEADASLALTAGGAASGAFFGCAAVAVRVACALERGDLDEAHAAADDAAPWGAAPPAFTHALLAETLARVAYARADPAGAAEHARRAGEYLHALRAVTPTVVPWRSTAALALAACGQLEQAATLADEELALARAATGPRAIGIALGAKGVIGADLDALQAAADTLARADARLEQARALCDLGAALRRANRRAEARAPLREAGDLAHRCRASALADRARTELLATGARPRRLVLTGVESLTPSERRVAAMAAEGLSNPQIAQALFVSTRTVEGHLTHVFRKLDVGSRTELRERM